MVSTKQLEEGNITSLIVKFSGPAIVGMLVMAIYNVVDRIYIGRGVGPLGLAGVTVGFPMMMLVMALTALIGIGGTAIVSLRLGEKKQDEAERVMGSAIVMMIGMAVIIAVTGSLFLDNLLSIFGASENILPYAREYMRIILLGIVFQITSFGLNNFIRAEGNPKVAMITMIIGAVINIILDPILIFGFEMGIRGAALATVFSQFVSSVWIISYFLRGKSLLKIQRKYLRIDIPLSLNILTVGLPAFFKQISTSLTIIILNNSLLLYGGDLAISAFGVVHSVMTLMLMPIF
ncbi:MAG: MATE family efflux transporter, partial [Firmicutes bacterium]|nr:MATE family efflux transporter [Bacillota bacterium]